jgi:hypothetical protein
MHQSWHVVPEPLEARALLCIQEQQAVVRGNWQLTMASYHGDGRRATQEFQEDKSKPIEM